MGLAIQAIESNRAIVHPETERPVIRSAQYSLQIEQDRQKHDKFIHIANEVYTDDD